MRKRFVDSDDVRIHVVEEGPEDGPPILFIHGFPEFWWSWRHQLTTFGNLGYRAVAMDLRGFGESSRPDDVGAYSLGKSFRDVTAVIETLGGRVPLVTHDWGGAVGWAYTALWPERVDRLAVMNAPHPYAYREIRNDLTQLQASWYVFFFQLADVAEEILLRNDGELLRRWFYDTAVQPLPEDDVERYIESFSRPGAMTAALNWYRANLPPRALLAEEGVDLSPITCPVTVIWGEQDAYLSLDVGRRAKEFVGGPYAFHGFRDAGHWVQQECPAEVNALVRDFLVAG